MIDLHKGVESVITIDPAELEGQRSRTHCGDIRGGDAMSCATCKHCRSDEYDDYNSVARIDYYCTLEDTDEPLTTLTACVHHTTEQP